MAKVGLKYVYVGKAGGTDGKYTDKQQVGLAVKADVKLIKQSASLDCEDAEHDKCNMVTGGTVTLETEGIEDEVLAFMLGKTKDEDTGVYIDNADDVAPFLGMSTIAERFTDGVYTYKATWLKKVMFSIPDDAEETKKTGSVNLLTTTIEGSILLDDNRDYREYKTFSTLTEAKSWVDGHFSASIGA